MKKMSYKEIMAAELASKSNSDLTNLANAALSTTRFLKSAKKWLEEVEAFSATHITDIEAMVARIEGGEEIDVKDIKTLYNRRVPEFHEFIA